MLFDHNKTIDFQKTFCIFITRKKQRLIFQQKKTAINPTDAG